MTLTSGSIKGKQLNLCKGNIIFCHVDCFCLQKKRKMKEKYFAFPVLRRLPQQSMNLFSYLHRSPVVKNEVL